MSDQGGWNPPDRPGPPPSIHNRPTQPGGAWEPPTPPAYPPPPPVPPAYASPPPASPPPGGGWQPPPGGGWQPPPGGGWQAQPSAPYSYGAPPGVPKNEPLATWSVVLGVLSFVLFFIGPLLAIPAIITGVLGKKAIDRSGGARTGRGAAAAGEILGIVNLALGVLAIGGLVILGLAATKHTRYTDLQAGDCYNRISSNSIFKGQVDKVDCTKAHDTEVSGTFDATDPGRYPAAAGFRLQAEPKCSEVGTQYLGSGSPTGLRVVWLAPDQSTWDGGTHTVVCGIQNADGSRHTGSVHG